MNERGPIYSVPLIDSLPLDGGMLQAMPSRGDLLRVKGLSTRAVAGYEVLLGRHHQMVEALEAIAGNHDAGPGIDAEELCELITQRARAVLQKIRGTAAAPG
jgi:hypothetical protein